VILRVDFKDAKVRRGLELMEGRRKSLVRVFRKLRPVLRDELRAAADGQSSPEGSWPRRARSTEDKVEKRASTHTFTRKHKKPKIGPRRVETSTRKMTGLLGKLPETVATRTRGGMFAALIGESKIEWAGVHNAGGVVGRGSVIPARPFVFLSPAFKQRAAIDISKFVAEGWRKA